MVTLLLVKYAKNSNPIIENGIARGGATKLTWRGIMILKMFCSKMFCTVAWKAALFLFYVRTLFICYVDY